MSDEYKRYMSEEWGFEKRGDVALFEKLTLEGAQANMLIVLLYCCLLKSGRHCR